MVLRLATWNVEWMNALFDDDGALLLDDGRSARHGVTRARQAKAVADVLRALDADAVLIVEGPDTSRRRNGRKALVGFAAWAGLRTSVATIGFANDTQQEILFLHDPARLSVVHVPRADPGAPRFDTALEMDLDIDATPDTVTFSKPPLELELTVGARALSLIGVHVKSKAPHGATDPDHARALSIRNRRKQLAQCIWLRCRVDALLDEGRDVLVLGDLNDGPGLDAYEALFGRSGVEIVLGEGTTPPDRQLTDPHARLALSQRLGAQPATARFYRSDLGGYISALLDYIMLSPGLAAGAAPRWRIWHPFDDPACFADADLRAALLDASDHFPVTVDLQL